MCPEEWWWIYRAKVPQTEMMTEEDKERLYNLIEDEECQQ